MKVGLYKKADHWRIDLGLWCWRRLFKSSLEFKEIKLVSLKGNQLRIFIGSTVAEAPIIWPPHVKSQLVGKDADARTDWREKEKEASEDEMVGDETASPPQWTRIWANWERVEDRGVWHSIVHEIAKSWTQLSNWTTQQQLGLQCSVDFCCTTTRISHNYIRVCVCVCVCVCVLCLSSLPPHSHLTPLVCHRVPGWAPCVK